MEMGAVTGVGFVGSGQRSGSLENTNVHPLDEP
jgi:hypothetical protein